MGGSGTAKGEKYGDNSLIVSVFNIRVETPFSSFGMGEGIVTIYLEQGKKPCVAIFDGVSAPVKVSPLHSTS